VKIYFGLDEIEGGWDRYMDRFNLLEVPETKNPATVETLNRWRVESPRGFAFVLHAPRAFTDELSAIVDRGDDSPTDTLREAWSEVVERSSALAAKAILIETDAEFTPSTRSRALLEKVSEEFGSTVKARLIWSSFGLWEPASTRDFAESIGLAYALDPFIHQQEGGTFTHGDGCFVVQERSGSRRYFDQFDFENMLEWGETYDRVFVLLKGRYKSKHARELGDVVARRA
jgi:hypothetical protein